MCCYDDMITIVIPHYIILILSCISCLQFNPCIIYLSSVVSVSILRAIGIDEQVDEVIVDFSPLRSIESIHPLLSMCRDESTKYDSLVIIEDNTESAISEWGSSNLAAMFDNDAIWRIPSITVGFQFSIRAESKQVDADVVVMSYM